jgi:hypothetical protein
VPGYAPPMIVRRRSGPGAAAFIAIAQHDHGLVSGRLARSWTWGGTPGPEAVFAIGHHDVGWLGLDAFVRWNAEEAQPYTFMDYPMEEKYEAYRAGIDLVATASPYSGWLVSRHFARFASMLDDPRSAAFVVAERARQGRLEQAFTPEQAQRGEFDFDLLVLCDALSLFLCLNEPGQNTWPWYRDGLRFRGERLMPTWDGPHRLRLEPGPLAEPVDVDLTATLLDAAGAPVGTERLTVTVGP